MPRHDERALDTAVRRFPFLLRAIRRCPESIEALVRAKQDDIIAEYRRILGKKR